MRFISLLSLTAVALLLGACASDGEPGLNYREAVVTPTLETPPDLITRNLEGNLEVPGSNIGKPENTGRFVDTGNLNVEPRTLPRFEGMRIRGAAGLALLEVDAPAEQVWPLLRAFWAEQGFRLLKDEPAVGVMETEWLSMKTGSDSFLSSLLASLRAAEFRDQYLTRVERADGDRSRIRIAHRGQELVVDDANPRSGEGAQGWQLMPPDPDKEREMLSRLMIFLGMQDDQRRAELQKLGLFQPLAKLARDDEDASPYLLVRQSFEQSWNRLIHALDRLSVPVGFMSVDGEQGRLELDGRALSELTGQKLPERVTLSVQGNPNANATRILVRRANDTVDGSGPAVAVLQFLYRQLK